jgi:hypothetical protein
MGTRAYESWLTRHSSTLPLFDSSTLPPFHPSTLPVAPRKIALRNKIF